jgi:C4-dicarboxylate-specific signal transduction histidine kinase
MGGAFIALMHFNLLPSVLLVTMLTMDKIGWGRRFVLRSSAALIAACTSVAWISHATVQLPTGMTELIASLPLMVAYPVAVASTSNRSGRLAREHRKAAEETAALREQLAHIGRVGTMGEMAAGLAHELNQPLTAIHVEASAAIELAGAGDFDSVRASLTRISEQSLRAGDIVRRMRQFSRREESSRERLEVGQLIHEVLALLDHDLRLAGVQTALTFRDRLPPVVADRVEIQQVLVNFIRNSLDAMARPAIAVRRLTIRTEVVKSNVRVSITDTGGGVDATLVPKLFHPFQTTKPAGLGLGLTICQSLIEAHGGRVGAGPHPGDGSTFFFELPAAQDATS